MRIETTITNQKLDVEIDEAAVIERMLSNITGGERCLFMGKRKNGNLVLFYEKENEYDKHRIEGAIITDVPKEVEKFHHLMKLYNLLTGRDYCSVWPSELSIAAANQSYIYGDLF